jgi:hypothetical protein
MRCTKIHDSIYYDAFLVVCYSPDTAYRDDDPLLANAYAVCWEREQFHNVHHSQFASTVYATAGARSTVGLNASSGAGKRSWPDAKACSAPWSPALLKVSPKPNANAKPPQPDKPKQPKPRPKERSRPG